MTKKSFVFIAPAALAAAAIGGVVSGAAGTIGRKAVEDAWNKEDKPKPSKHVYQIDVGNMTRYELNAAIAELKEAWTEAHAKPEEPPHSPFYQGK